LAEKLLPPTTAGISPEQFPDQLFFCRNRLVIALILAVLLAVGFAFRVHDLGAESLGEDEFNKLQTVAEYRQNGLSSRNGEHPFLMKGMQAVSIAASEKLNSSFSFSIPEEAALRFPLAFFGTFSIVLLFLVVSELFGRSIGLVSAALWAVEPLAIGFDRVAKEDSLVLFFFLLTSLFWLRGQSAAERGDANWRRWVWFAAAAFGALLASKYYLNLLGVLAAYYHSFTRLPGTKWGLGRPRWLLFFVIMGISLLILNPTLLLPDTWREMLKFSSEGRVGHDSYEYIGTLYPHKVTVWLAGVPWTFYYVLAATKSSLTTLAFFVPGVVLLFRRKMGDGRFFVFFWFFVWYLPFTVLGGKFMRYFTVSEPLVLIAAAVGFCAAVHLLSGRLSVSPWIKSMVQGVAFTALLVLPVIDSLSASPHYRMFTNALVGEQVAGKYFPHDEFYDASTREVITAIASNARQGAVVACETTALFEHYAEKAGRGDLEFVSLSDKARVGELREGDFVVLSTGRRYFSNTAYFDLLKNAPAVAETKIAGVASDKICQLDVSTLAGVRAIAQQ